MLRNDIKNNITIPNYIKLKYSQFWILIYQSIIDFLLYLWKLIDNVSYSNLTQKFKLYSWVCMYHSWKEKIHFWKTKTFIWCVSIAHCYHLVYTRPIATLFWWFERTYVQKGPMHHDRMMICFEKKFWIHRDSGSKYIPILKL